MVDVEPIDIYEAKKIAKSYAKSVGSRLVLRQTEGRSLDPEEQAEFQRASGAAQLIGDGQGEALQDEDQDRPAQRPATKGSSRPERS